MSLVANKNNWQVRASVYELLAISLRYPDMALVDALVSGEYCEAVDEIATTLELELDEPLSELLAPYIGADSNAINHALRVESTRLFVGAPDPIVSPFEGVWRASDDGVQALLFVNPHSMAVERFMRSCGAQQAEGKNEPLDHIATELEFLQHLSMLAAGMVEPQGDARSDVGDWSALHCQFVDEHAKVWMPRFADAVIQHAREPLFCVVGKLLREVI